MTRLAILSNKTGEMSKLPNREGGCGDFSDLEEVILGNSGVETFLTLYLSFPSLKSLSLC